MNAPRALVLRYHSLGDVILVTGVVRALHEAGFLVDVVTEARFRSIFEGSPHVTGLLTREQWAPDPGTSVPGAPAVRVYDRVVDLQASPSSRRALRDLRPRAAVNTRSLARRWVVLTADRPPRPSIPHAALRYAEAAFDERFGGPTPPALDSLVPEVTVTEADRAGLARQLPGLEAGSSSAGGGLSRPRIALLTGASRASKAYPRERFVAVGRAFAERGWEVLWVEAPSPSVTTAPERGGSAESAAIAPIRDTRSAIPDAPVGLRVAVGLGALKALLSTVDLAVSGDSGPMHLATALGVPVVAVFGSSVRTFGFAPIGPRTRVMEVSGLFCRPCGVHGRDRCWRGGFPCLEVSPEAVVSVGLGLAGARASADPKVEGAVDR